MRIPVLIAALCIAILGNSQLSLDTIRISQVEILVNESFQFQRPAGLQIDSIKLASYSHSELGELLETSSNVQVKVNNPGGITTVSFRGLSASHTFVSWNGMKLNSPLSGQFDFSLIPVDFIDQILIRPGNSALEEQTGSVSGSILLKNQAKYRKGVHFSISQELGSFGKTGSFLNVQLGSASFQSITRLGYRSADNDFEFENTAVLPHQTNRLIQSGFQARYISQEFYYRPGGKQQISVISWYSGNNRELPPHMTRLDDPQFILDHYSEDLQDELIAQLIKWDGEHRKISWSITSGYLFRNNLYQLETTSPDNELIHAIQYQNQSSGFQLAAEFEYELLPSLKYKSTLQSERQFTSIRNLISQQAIEPDMTRLSWTHALLFALNEQVKCFVINRSEMNSIHLAGFIPGVGIEYQPEKWKGFSTNITLSGTYRLPELNDLYFLPGGNPDLLPESGATGELNFNYKLPSNPLQLNFAVYYAGIRNWILWKDTEYGYWTPENLEYVHSKGIEAGVVYKRAFHNLTWSAAIDYNLSLVEYAGSDPTEILLQGEQLIYVPKHSGHLQFNLDYKNYQLLIAQQIVGKRTVMQTNLGGNSYQAPSLPAYYPVMLQFSRLFSYKKTDANIGFRINNLFNQQYQVFYLRPMPGIHASLHLKFLF